MFTSLYVAKKCNAISFDWTETAVIVYGLRHLLTASEFLAVCLVTTEEGDSYRAEVEYMLATELGILTQACPALWKPEEFRQ